MSFLNTRQCRILVTVLVGFVVGVLFWGGFNWSMEITNTESFCISCHEMENNVYQEYKETIHYRNESGVRATCPDCHVPREWVYKVERKVKATNELFHKIIGSIDTKEKFNAKRMQLAEHVWTGMTESDSHECRNCHDMDAMRTQTQGLMAGKMHELSIQWNLTCIECHQGIAHQLPVEFDREALIDKWHERIESEGLKCRICHEDMQTVPAGDDW